ncbi:MAG: DMT family transporter [Desulfobacteraceae bacterium]|jgi:drug/metabolite transporter (DMT)-like permease
MKDKTQGLLQIHLAVLLFGLAGLFGKLLSLSPFIIVLGRAFFASMTLGLVLVCLRHSLRVHSKKDLLAFIGLGGILALHWTTFFHAIQVSTVAIGLLTYATFPAFVTFMEPYFFRERFRLFDIFTAALVACGIILVIPTFDFAHNVTQGAFWGTLSGFTFAVLSLLNRKYVKTYSSLVIAFYQNTFAMMTLLPFLAMLSQSLVFKDILLLGVLGLFCTALAHGLFIKALEHLRAQLASITACLEPLYGVLFALLLLGELPALRTVAGGAVILGTAVLASARSRE